MAENNPEIRLRNKASLPLFEQARARRSDPRHSHEAAASVQNLGRTREAIKKILKDYGPSTDERIALIYRGLLGKGESIPESSPSGLRSRRAELVKMGFVEDSGNTGRTAAGRPCSIWRLAK